MNETIEPMPKRSSAGIYTDKPIAAAESMGTGLCSIGDILQPDASVRECFKLSGSVSPVAPVCFGFNKHNRKYLTDFSRQLNRSVRVDLKLQGETK